MTDASSVAAWIADDPDPETARELQTLLDAAQAGDINAQSELDARFSGLLQFGTAGLRGELGGGPNRMNRAVVIRAAAAIVDYVASVIPAGGVPRIVIGYDARRNSQMFARDSAAVITAAGGEALLMPHIVPTPVLAFATNKLDADAGIMVTASHNPPQDNGYKVYLGGRVVSGPGRGVQLVPPHDQLIATRLAQIESVSAVPQADSGWTVLSEATISQYLSAVIAATAPGPRDLRIVLSSMHGVGGPAAEATLRGVGFTDLHIVAEQAEPDPDFPTVPFPNPEEKGALDLAIALAKKVEADLVLANDPDADRCAAAVFDGRLGEWRKLHGDEIGALLGAGVAREVGQHPDEFAYEGSAKPVLANSIVSSRLLGKIAAAAGLEHVETLTGFKWIARAPGIVYGYEEAIGYCVAPTIVRDKDGISAGIALACLAAEMKAVGRTLLDALDDLARTHGLHLTDQVSLRFVDLAQIPATMAHIRSHPPTELAGSPVVRLDDLAEGSPALPPTDGIRILSADGTRVVIRPSGTEPKVKCYLEVIEPVADTATAVPALADPLGLPAEQLISDPVGMARQAAHARICQLAAQIRTLLEV